jgi:hypothetical protein
MQHKAEKAVQFPSQRMQLKSWKVFQVSEFSFQDDVCSFKEAHAGLMPA